MSKHSVGDLVYYRANKRVFADENQPSIGVITKCYQRHDIYRVKWLNDEDVLYQREVMTEFTGQAIEWFKRDLEEALKNDGTQNW